MRETIHLIETSFSKNYFSKWIECSRNTKLLRMAVSLSLLCGLRTGVSNGGNPLTFYYLIMCHSWQCLDNRGNIGIDQSIHTQFVNFLCVVSCARHMYWGYRRLKQNLCPLVAWLSWKRGMQIYLQSISDKGQNPKWEWPVWFWITLVRWSCLFLFSLRPNRPTIFLRMIEYLLGSWLPLPPWVSPPFTCPALPSSQEMAPRGWIREVDFILHALCSVLGRASWWARSFEQVLRVLNNTKCTVYVF